MPRDLHPDTAAALSANDVQYAILEMYTFKSGVTRVWSGPGPLTVSVDGAVQTFTGVGSYGSVGELDEGSDGQAEGTTSTLSGIDPVYLASALTDVKLGAPAKRWLALMDEEMNVIGEPYLWFSGQVDKPPVYVGGDKISVTLTLEGGLKGHRRTNSLKYTNADQRLLYPDDTGFSRVEKINDIALRIDN